MIVIALLALFAGILCGTSGMDNRFLSALSTHKDLVLYVLMFSVGISIGLHHGLIRSIRQYHVKIFIIPFGGLRHSDRAEHFRWRSGGERSRLVQPVRHHPGKPAGRTDGKHCLLKQPDAGAVFLFQHPSSVPSELLCLHRGGRRDQRGHHPAADDQIYR